MPTSKEIAADINALPPNFLALVASAIATLLRGGSDARQLQSKLQAITSSKRKWSAEALHEALRKAIGQAVSP